MHELFSTVTYQDLGVLGYWLVFLFALLESIAVIGLFTPGSFVVVFAGALAAHGYYDFTDLVIFCIGGALIGDALSYEFGRHGKTMLEHRPFFTKHIKNGQLFFEKYGAASIVLGRFVGALRPFVPFVAGMSHMPRMRFYIADVIGAVGWSVTFIGAGYLFGTAWVAAYKAWTRAGALGLLLVLLIMLCVYFWRSFTKRNIKETLVKL